MNSWISTPAVMHLYPLSRLLLRTPVDPAVSRPKRIQVPPPITTTTPMEAVHRRQVLTHSHLLVRRLSLLTPFLVPMLLNTCQLQGAVAYQPLVRPHLQLDQTTWHEKDLQRPGKMRTRGRMRICSLVLWSRRKGISSFRWYLTRQIQPQPIAVIIQDVLRPRSKRRPRDGLRIPSGSLHQFPRCPSASTHQKRLCPTPLT